MKRFKISILPVILCILVLLSFASCKKTDDDKRIKVISAIFPSYDFVRQIAKSRVSIELLIQPGAEVHSYEPTAQDIVKISKCQVFIYAGGEEDTWIDSILEAIDTSKIKIISLMDCISDDNKIIESHELAGGGTGEIEYDEHVWTSLANAKIIVNTISSCLQSVDAINADFYKDNTNAYLISLSNLQVKYKEMISTARLHKIVVCDRFPFAYFCKEFELDHVAAFSGCTEEGDASAAVINQLIKTVKEMNIKYVFTIEFSNQKIAKTVCEATSASILTLHSCHNLSKSEFESGLTYLQLMTTNFDNLKRALS